MKEGDHSTAFAARSTVDPLKSFGHHILRAMPHETVQDPEVSVVAPAFNEAENVQPLVDEIVAAMRPTGWPYEIIFVNDGSNDATLAHLLEAAHGVRELRVLSMKNTPPDRGNGQSAAFHAGFRAARGSVIAVLDADRQNDPADLPRLIRMLHERTADLIQGDRTHTRRDSVVRRFSSRIGRLTRRWLLGDTVRDTGCSLRVMRREVALAIPLEYRGMHRFIPVTARHLGYKVLEEPVNHRPRVAGKAKYGIWNRAIPGLIDCLAVRWMQNRRQPVLAVEELMTSASQSADSSSGARFHRSQEEMSSP